MDLLISMDRDVFFFNKGREASDSMPKDADIQFSIQHFDVDDGNEWGVMVSCERKGAVVRTRFRMETEQDANDFAEGFSWEPKEK